MKPGDKVWVYESITQNIVEVEVLRVEENTRWRPEMPSPTVYVSLHPDDGGTPFWPGFDLFPTREELCEHYRKIFE